MIDCVFEVLIFSICIMISNLHDRQVHTGHCPILWNADYRFRKFAFPRSFDGEGDPRDLFSRFKNEVHRRVGRFMVVERLLAVIEVQ